MDIAIIGGGAAGFFAAIAVKDNFPEARVSIFEKTKKLLSKVKISGGGRCNLTHHIKDIKDFAKAYPRGEMQLRKGFGVFSPSATMEWFESRGVALVIQEDNCVFPASQKSQSIVDCFLFESKKLDIEVQLSKGIKKIVPIQNKLQLEFLDNIEHPTLFDKVIVATGGTSKRKAFDYLQQLGHKIESPIPSLFTFNMPKEKITNLMGIVVEKAKVSIQGTKLKSEGALLITHWGMSGPAVLKLSSFGARRLHELDYQFKIQINWVNEVNNDIVKNSLIQLSNQHPKKQLRSIKPYNLPERLWIYLIERIQIPSDKIWNEVGRKGINKIVNVLCNDIYSVSGRTSFKEEFVTCGGVSLESIDFKTMQSKKVKNLYFAGEVIDVDGITGGFNFQAAWTTAFIAGKLL